MAVLEDVGLVSSDLVEGLQFGVQLEGSLEELLFHLVDRLGRGSVPRNGHGAHGHPLYRDDEVRHQTQFSYLPRSRS